MLMRRPAVRVTVHQSVVLVGVPGAAPAAAASTRSSRVGSRWPLSEAFGAGSAVALAVASFAVGVSGGFLGWGATSEVSPAGAAASEPTGGADTPAGGDEPLPSRSPRYAA